MSKGIRCPSWVFSSLSKLKQDVVSLHELLKNESQKGANGSKVNYSIKETNVLLWKFIVFQYTS